MVSRDKKQKLQGTAPQTLYLAILYPVVSCLLYLASCL